MDLVRRIARIAAAFILTGAATAQAMVEPCWKNHYILEEPCVFAWRAANEGLADLDIRVVTVDPSDPSTVYAGGPGGLFKSRDGAAAWSKTGFDPAPVVAEIRSFSGPPPGFVAGHALARLVIDPRNRNTLYAATHWNRGCVWSQQRLFKSVDGGATWSGLLDPWYVSGCDTIYSLALAPSDSSTLYVTTFEEIMWDSYPMLSRSNNASASWSYHIDPALRVVVVDPRDANTLYGGTIGYGLYDASWYTTQLGNPPLPFGVLKSTDGGVSWTATGLSGPGISALAIGETPSLALYAAAFYAKSGAPVFKGLFRSLDAGASWVALNDGLESLLDGKATVTSIVLDEASPPTVYLGTDGAGVWRSVDGGLTWRAFNEGLPSLAIRTLALAPGFPSVLYAATPAGVFRIEEFVSRVNMRAARALR